MLGEKSRSGLTMLQAVFYPSKDFDISLPPSTTTLSWLGYLNNLWYYENSTNNIANLREETLHDNFLNLQTDYIVSFDFVGSQLVVRSWDDTDGDGVGNVQLADKLLDDVEMVWEAGEILFKRTPGTRKIFVNDSGTSYPKSPNSTICGSNNLVAFSTPNKACFGSYLGTDLNNDAAVNAADNTQADRLINYIIGTDYPEYRKRTLPLQNPIDASVAGTWKLGDIIYSTPQILKYDNTYSDYSVAYVGANDGMLHAFKVGKLDSTGLSGTTKVQLTVGSKDTIALGEEMWAFIPKNALPYLRFYADPNYCHNYTIDLSPYIYRYGSNRLLIGGMRLGGACGGTSTLNPPTDTCSTPTSPYPSTCIGMSSYFALNVKDPNNPKLLWEFSDPALKFTFSGPAVVNYNNTRFVIFLSGPENYSGNSSQNLRVFVLKLNADDTINTVYTKDMGTSYANGFGGRLFTKGLDMNEDGNTDFVFFGYSKYINTVSGYPQWGGGVAKIYITGANPNAWVYNDYVTFANTNGFPITSKVTFDKCFDNYYLYFTSGRYFTSNELYNTSAGPVTNKPDIVA
ncbi:Tfp pilus assembly protein tip-associated adhesin PilY1-like protein [Candidatus Magnetobacterium bavaricum]|uniref:Tfp pilus assembly protein tip-associated adhesin PilY1-like protein n=1 Tax=Candidatus Magnetobacterium bavaricum TaxID=29290 RepID=A0A0F3GLT4_9BACT|nr:Tfp pilus assembly protein tip-associated adhesin PilY1-like protein [Candidatus Magnetobacterium bavaricum]